LQRGPGISTAFIADIRQISRREIVLTQLAVTGHRNPRASESNTAMIGKHFRIGFMAMLHAVFSLSVAAAPSPDKPAFGPPVEHARLLGALQLQGEVFHVQGLALGGSRLWVTSVDHRTRKAWLHEFERANGRFVRRLELTDGARYHPGGLSLSGGSIWVPVAEMKANSSAVLVEIDAHTLHVRRRIAVADHIGCVAASGRTLVAGNWDSRLLVRVRSGARGTGASGAQSFGDALSGHEVCQWPAGRRRQDRFGRSRHGRLDRLADDVR